MQNILSILSLLKIVLILLLWSTPTRVMWRIHSYLFHASRISVNNNLWKCFESAYEVKVQCIEYFVVDRDTIDPHALWNLNWVNFPFSGERSIYPTTYIIKAHQNKEQKSFGSFLNSKIYFDNFSFSLFRLEVRCGSISQNIPIILSACFFVYITHCLQKW